MRVLVLWANGDDNPNLGVRVLGEGAAWLARAAWGPGIEVEHQDFVTGSTDVAFGPRAVARDALWLDRTIHERLRQFDAVIDTGAGDSFTDIYGLRRLVTMTYVHAVARRLGIPVLLAPQTIGPFQTRVGRLLGRRRVRWAEALTVRDPESGLQATQLGRGVDAESTDLVFALVRPVRTSTRDVIVNVSGLLWSENRHVSAAAYRQALSTIVGSLTAGGRHVTLLPHVVGPRVPLGTPGSEDNDVPATYAFADQFAQEPLVDVMEPIDLDDVRRIMASARIVVGARMHACLNALSVGTPAVPMAYSRKFEPLLDALNWPYVVDLRRDSDPAQTVLAHISALTSAPTATAATVRALLNEAEAKVSRATEVFARSVTGP